MNKHRMTAEDREVIAKVAKHNPLFVTWLAEWRMSELERLPSMSVQTVQISQGRCQILDELLKELKQY